MNEPPEQHLGSVNSFWKQFAAAFAHPLTANGALSGFVSNPSITGAYAEVWVRSMVRSMLPGLRVSTGAIICSSDYGADLRKIPQIDIIVWDPSELPALFERDDFALVHTQAARAIIEIKRTISSKNECLEQLNRQQLRLLSDYRRNVFCVVVSHPKPLMGVNVVPNWPAEKSLGSQPELTRLLDAQTADADTDGVFALIYFLSYVARHVGPPHTIYPGQQSRAEDRQT